MMRRTTLLAALALAGCGTAPLYGEWPPARTFLPVAAPGDPAAEVRELLDWVPRRRVPRTETPGKPSVARARGDARFALRCGLLVPASAEWNASVRVGICYRMRLAERWPLELGFDYNHVGTDDRTVSSSIFGFRADVCWPFRGGGARRLYALSGVAFMMERGRLLFSDADVSTSAVGIDLGVGYGEAGGRWDTRLVVSPLLGSTNVPCEILVSAAVGF